VQIGGTCKMLCIALRRVGVFVGKVCKLVVLFKCCVLSTNLVVILS